MTARPVFLKLAAFFFAFAAALSVVALFGPALTPRRPVARPATPDFAIADNLDTKVELVSLDRESGRSYTRLRLRLVGRSLRPERLWVRLSFFNPSDPSGRVRGDDAVEVVRPFDGGSPAAFTVTSTCSWCDDEDAPASGYFANVEIFEDRGGAKPSHSSSQFSDLTTAVPVVVHAERVAPPRR